MCERNVRIAGLTMWCLMVWLLSVAPAGAAIVVRTSEGEYDTDVTAYLWSVVSVRAGGADNRMRIGEGRASVTIRDQRERFRLGPSGLDFGGEKTAPCVLVGRHAARCPVLPPSSAHDRWSPSVIVDTGAGNDRLFISARAAGVSTDVFADLGAGDDTGWLGKAGRLSGGLGRDRLTVTRADPGGTKLEGEAGDDILVGATQITGGPGDDVLRGSRFSDDLSPGPGRDLVDGREGRDMLTYEDPAGVRVDLRLGSAWSPHGSVRLTSITDVASGEGDDVLLGDAGPNTLDGRRGRNLVLAGDGNDTIKNARVGSSCGRGRDTALVPVVSELEEVTDWNDGEVLSPPVSVALSAPVPYDCEVVRLGDYLNVGARPLVTRTEVTFSAVGEDFDAELIWELRAGWGTAGRRLGRVTTRRAGARVTVPLNSAGRACVSRRDCRAALTVNEPPDVINDDPSTPLPLWLTG